MRKNVVTLLLILGATAVFQAWFLGLGWRTLWASGSDHSLVVDYTRALASGHAYLLTPPDPRVLSAPDPYRSPYLLLDASLYKGRYYLYFGAVPFLILLVPWHLATGTHLPATTAILLYSLLGYAAYGGTLLLVARGLVRRVRAALAGVVFVGLVTCSGTWPLMGRPDIYELENAAAFGLFACAVFAAALATVSKGSRRWFMAATALAGLALGCRPNIFPAVGVLTLYTLCLSFTASGATGGRAARLAWPLVPVALIGLGLAGWNYHRFDSPLDFGVKQFSQTSKASGLLVTSVRNVPYNAERYIAGAARLGGYSPFIEGQREGLWQPAPGQEPSNQVYGFLILSPFLMWALLLPFAPRSPEGPRLGLPAAALALAALGNLLYLSLIGFSCYRYPADFLGPLGLLACIGVLQCGALWAGWGRWLFLAMLSVTVAWSACWALFETASIARVHAMFDVNRPEDFQRLARPFNAASYRLEGLVGGGPRYLRLNLRFPRDKFGGVEPLVVTGAPSAQDFLYLYYTGPGAIQFGFESMGHGGRVSGPIPMDYGTPHMVDVFFGNFLPPDDHPLLAGLSKADLAMDRRFVRISLDGKIVMDGAEELHPLKSRVFVGASPDDAAFGRAFTGVIVSTQRPLIERSLLAPNSTVGAYGPVSLELVLAPLPSGSLEPILSMGYRPTGGVLALERHREGEVRLDWMRFGKVPLRSSSFRMAPGAVHRLKVSAGALFPPQASLLWTKTDLATQAQLKRRMLCTMDGQVVMDLAVDTPDTSPHEVFVGRNTVGISEVSQTFSGTLVTSTREPW